MIPCLAFECREVGQLRKLVWRRFCERDLALLRHYQQDIVIGQENKLAVAVAFAFPLELAVFKIDANERAAVEAKSVTFMNDKIVEPGIYVFGSPPLLPRPAAGRLGHCKTPKATALTHAHQQVAVGRNTRLHDRNAFPLVFPQKFSVSK